MTNKKKARARKLSEKTGMSHQAAVNALNTSTTHSRYVYIEYLPVGAIPIYERRSDIDCKVYNSEVGVWVDEARRKVFTGIGDYNLDDESLAVALGKLNFDRGVVIVAVNQTVELHDWSSVICGLAWFSEYETDRFRTGIPVAVGETAAQVVRKHLKTYDPFERVYTDPTKLMDELTSYLVETGHRVHGGTGSRSEFITFAHDAEGSAISWSINEEHLAAIPTENLTPGEEVTPNVKAGVVAMYMRSISGRMVLAMACQGAADRQRYEKAKSHVALPIVGIDEETRDIVAVPDETRPGFIKELVSAPTSAFKLKVRAPSGKIFELDAPEELVSQIDTNWLLPGPDPALTVVGPNPPEPRKLGPYTEPSFMCGTAERNYTSMPELLKDIVTYLIVTNHRIISSDDPKALRVGFSTEAPNGTDRVWWSIPLRSVKEFYTANPPETTKEGKTIRDSLASVAGRQALSRFLHAKAQVQRQAVLEPLNTALADPDYAVVTSYEVGDDTMLQAMLDMPPDDI